MSQVPSDVHVSDRLSEYLDGDLSIAQSAHVESHLERCTGCAAELRELRATVSLLRELPDPEPPSDLASRVVQRIADGEGRREARIPTFTRRLREPGFAAALAAGVAGLLWMSSIDSGSGDPLGTPAGSPHGEFALQSNVGRTTGAGTAGARRPHSPFPAPGVIASAPVRFRTIQPMGGSLDAGGGAELGVFGRAEPEAPLRDLDGELAALFDDPAAFVERFRRTPEDRRRPLIAPLVGLSAEHGTVDALGLYTSVGTRPAAVPASAQR